jgi:hypothetical protein
VKVRDPGRLDIGERTVAKKPCEGPAAGVEPEAMPSCLQEVPGTSQPPARVTA